MFGFLGDVASFFADGTNWQGEEGIPTLFREHVQLTVVPLVLGGGTRLFDGVAVALEQEFSVASPVVTHVRYRVV